SSGQHQRSPWFGVACCPGNMTRFLASVPGYMYAHHGDTVYVNLFAASTADVVMDGGRAITLAQETRYPWDGTVKISGTGGGGPYTLAVRIPGWARNEAVPSGLYRFADAPPPAPTLAVNGQAVSAAAEKGYAHIKRQWKKGDVVELTLPLPVRRVVAADAVEADRGRVALQRGPLVFAAEWPDNPGGRVRNLVLSADTKLATDFRPALLGGVQVITGRAVALSVDESGGVRRQEQDFTAIPYYAWANRGPGEM